MSSIPIDHPKQNRILAALHTEEYARLEDDLEIVSLRSGQILYEPGDKLVDVYFPITCIVSLIFTTENGASAELAMTGNDGLVGITLILGGETANRRTVVQCAGNAYRAKAEVIRWELAQNGNLQRVALLYVHALIAQMAQRVVCNRHHSVDQQLCRWLLFTLDRLPRNQLNITQDLIANLLGVRREAITESAGKLQAAGIIHYSRGLITVIDRPGLEARVCECYSAVKSEHERIGNLVPEVRSRNRARPNPLTLRKRAEKRLQQSRGSAPSWHRDDARLQHEMQIQQIELKMQNEELQHAYDEADTLGKRYADIYDFAPIGYFTLDAQGAIVDLNLAGAILLGIKRSQKLRHRFAAFVTHDHLPAFNRFVKEVRSTKGKTGCDIVLLPIDQHAGRRVRIEAVPDESGEECRMVVIDITAEKQAEEALKAREQSLHALLDNFPFMVWLKDEEGRYLAVNALFAKNFGMPSPEALVGKTDFDITAPDLAESYRTDDLAIMHSGQQKRVEERVEIGGEIVWCETYKSPITIDDQRIGTVGFAQNISERHAAQQALEASEKRHRSFIENLPLSVVIIQDGIIKYINSRAVELFGYSAETCIGQSFLPMIVAADRAKVLAAHQLRMAGELAPLDYEVRIVSKTGPVIACRCYISAVTWDERIASLGVFEAA